MFNRLPQTAHFRIGAVELTLETSLRTVLADYRNLYSHCEVPHLSSSALHVEVRRQSLRIGHRRRIDVAINGDVQFQPLQVKEVLPCIEWCVNWAMPDALSRFLQIHAASMVVNGMGVIFPGASGAGKSTLATGLMAGGWQYMCDEYALVDCESLKLHPYPRAICIKEPSFPIVHNLGMKLARGKYYVKGFKGHVGYINPTHAGVAVGDSPVSIKRVVFPQYDQHAAPSITSLHRAEAAFLLHQYCFNLSTCCQPATRIIAELVRHADCYRLVTGDLRATCDLVSSTLLRPARHLAKSA